MGDGRGITKYNTDMSVTVAGPTFVTSVLSTLTMVTSDLTVTESTNMAAQGTTVPAYPYSICMGDYVH